MHENDGARKGRKKAEKQVETVDVYPGGWPVCSCCGRPRLDRAKLEAARQDAMVRALFFWEISERVANVSSRAGWEKRGNDEMVAAIRLDKELQGSRRG